jgi:hypothetical protein
VVVRWLVLRPAIPSQAPSSAAWVALPLALRRRRATDDSPLTDSPAGNTSGRAFAGVCSR